MPPTSFSAVPSRRAILAFLVALVLGNVALTFANAWPTPGVRPTATLSVELAAAVLLVCAGVRRGTLPPWWRATLAALLTALIPLRYTDVTTAGLFGKPLDLYADIAHLPNVVTLLAGAFASPARIALALVIVGAFVGFFFFFRWALGALARPLAYPGWRLVTAVAAGLAVLASVIGAPGFARPGSLLLVEQARLLGRDATPAGGNPAFAGRPPPGARSDVFVLFLESYGARALADPAIAPTFGRLTAALAQSGWHAASALVRSPTFGGGSWLAHASLLSGRTIGDQRTYNDWLAAPPDTMVDWFRRGGYRTVAVMPGLIDPWPAGAGMRFDRIYAAADIAYRGPAFGFWRIPDQATLAWLAQTELAAPNRAPLFVLYPTIMSHIPFGPLPAYQPDWVRLTGPEPYDHGPGQDRLADIADFDYRPAYAAAVRYNLDVLAGFVGELVPPDAVLLVLGDHQPPAIVTGPGAAWSVPVHVIAHDPSRLAPFRRAGFVDGLRPAPAAIGPMADIAALLTEIDLDAAAGP